MSSTVVHELIGYAGSLLYVAPPFRDLRSGECLYADDGRRFAELGLRTLTVRHPDPRHLGYLGKMGFEEQEGVFVKHVG